MESVYEIPVNINKAAVTYDNNEVKLPVRTQQTGLLKKRTVIIIFLILIIISVGVCVGVYFAGKASAEENDDGTALPVEAVTDTVSKVTPGSTQVINGKLVISVTIK